MHVLDVLPIIKSERSIAISKEDRFIKGTAQWFRIEFVFLIETFMIAILITVIFKVTGAYSRVWLFANFGISVIVFLILKVIFDFIYSKDTASGIVEIIKSDLNSAIKHYEALNDTNYVAALNEKLSWLSNRSISPFGSRTLSTSPFFYKVRVIEVIDSTAITKIYSKEKFVKIREGDVVSIRKI